MPASRLIDPDLEGTCPGLGSPSPFGQAMHPERCVGPVAKAS